MSGVPQNTCTVCGEAGHKSSKCTSLNPPANGEFHKGSASSQGGGDDGDEKILKTHITLQKMYNSQYIWV